MLKFINTNGTITVNMTWIMTEAHVIAGRFGYGKGAMARGMRSAWFHAKMEASVQRSVAASQANVAALATHGADRLTAMISDVRNIDRYTAEDREYLGYLNRALAAA